MARWGLINALERELLRLVEIRAMNPEKFDKAKRLAEVTVRSIDYWLTRSDEELDKTLARLSENK